MEPFDRRRENLLAVAARVFAARGYDRTTMRDLSRASRMSLAGMYYYVKGKEDLLFEVQRGCFDRVRRGAEEAMAGTGGGGGGGGAEERLAAFIRHHVSFFAHHMDEMKVLSHEAESLTGARLEEVRQLKRAYVDICEGLLKGMDEQHGGERVNRHVAAYALFGMMNWIYTWYDPRGSVGVEELAESICRLFLNGYAAEVPVR